MYLHRWKSRAALPPWRSSAMGAPASSRERAAPSSSSWRRGSPPPRRQPRRRGAPPRPRPPPRPPRRPRAAASPPRAVATPPRTCRCMLRGGLREPPAACSGGWCFAYGVVAATGGWRLAVDHLDPTSPRPTAASIFLSNEVRFAPPPRSLEDCLALSSVSHRCSEFERVCELVVSNAGWLKFASTRPHTRLRSAQPPPLGFARSMLGTAVTPSARSECSQPYHLNFAGHTT